MRARREPLEWYVEKLHRNEPFSSLLYGDGEFMTMAGDRTGQRFTNYREIVTQTLVDELLSSLDEPGDDILRGTDIHLIDYMSYQGGDKDSIRAIGRRIEKTLGTRDIEWFDGVIWDTASRYGQLGPLLKVLHQKQVVLVGNEKLKKLKFLHPKLFLPIPDKNAWSQVDELEARLAKHKSPAVFLICTGLGAIPLVMRLRKKLPQSTFLDLGSVLDVFARLGEERGWRRDLYVDLDKYKKIIDLHLEGVCNERCRHAR